MMTFVYQIGNTYSEICSDWENVKIQCMLKKRQGNQTIVDPEVIDDRYFELDCMKDDCIGFIYNDKKNMRRKITSFYDNDGIKYQGGSLYTAVFYCKNVQHIQIYNTYMCVEYNSRHICEIVKMASKNADVVRHLGSIDKLDVSSYSKYDKTVIKKKGESVEKTYLSFEKKRSPEAVVDAIGIDGSFKHVENNPRLEMSRSSVNDVSIKECSYLQIPMKRTNEHEHDTLEQMVRNFKHMLDSL